METDISQIFMPIVVAIISVLGALFVGYLNRVGARRAELYKQLNEFYGPLLLHLHSIYGLYSFFAPKYKELYGSNFRTLTYLLMEAKFKRNDLKVIGQIVEIQEDMERLILSGAGLIDDFSIQIKEIAEANDLLDVGVVTLKPNEKIESLVGKSVGFAEIVSSFLIHIKFLRMAYRKEVAGEPERFESYAYPRILDRALRERITSLKRKLQMMNSVALEDITEDTTIFRI